MTCKSRRLVSTQINMYSTQFMHTTNHVYIHVLTYTCNKQFAKMQRLTRLVFLVLAVHWRSDTFTCKCVIAYMYVHAGSCTVDS